MAGSCSTGGRDEEMRGACRILIGKPDGEILFGGPGMSGRVVLKWTRAGFM
jgi:hypothetical protein